MIWYIIHNILKVISPDMEPQHRNLTTFLTGVVLYTIFYSYVGTLGREHTFLNVFFKYSVYILMADAFAMAILYKNFYKHTIFREVEETMGASGPKPTAVNVEPITTAEVEPSTTLKKASNSIINELFFPKPGSKNYPRPGSKKKSDEEKLPEILNESVIMEDEMEGFVKNSALGDSYNTNGVSNAGLE